MKSKKIVIAIIAILVVLSGTFAGLWFFTDVFNFLKPANDVFSDEVEKALNLEGVKFSDYSEFLNEYKDLSGKSVKGKLNLTANLNISELDSDVQKIINKSKITIETSNDVDKNRTQNKIGLYSGSSEVLTLDLVTNDTKLGIGCKDIYDKYLTASVEDIIKLAGEQSELDEDEIKQLLNSIQNSSKIDPYELLYISEKDLKHFDDTYRNCLTKLISKDCYTTEKNVEVSVDGETVKTTAYYLTLTGEDAYNFVNELIKLVKDDDVLARIITEKVNIILESSGEDKISTDDVKDLISELTKSLLEEIEYIKDEKDTAVQVAVYSNKSKPVRIELNGIKDVTKADEKETLLSMEYGENKFILSIFKNGEEVGSLVNEYTKNTDDEKSGKISVKVSGMSVGTLEYELVSKEDESKVDLSLSVPMANVSANFEYSSKGNYKKEPVTFSGSLNVKYQRESAKITFDGSTEYGDVSVPELTSSNSVEVLKLSETKMQELMMEVLEKASKVLPSRLELIGININADDILPSTVKPDTDVDANINPTDIQNEINSIQNTIDANNSGLVTSPDLDSVKNLLD